MSEGEREPLTVLLVDDHPMFREGVQFLLESEPDVSVVGHAGDGRAAVELAAALQPDVVVMDLNLPDMNGIEATRRIHEASPHINVLVVTMFDDQESVFSAMRAGARGYLLKGAKGAEISRAIRSVGDGEMIFGPDVARRVQTYLASTTASAAATAPFPQLTAREREVLDLIAAGKSNAEITKQLVLSPKTVRNHISNIFQKLQITDRAQAIVRAREAGMGSSPPRADSRR